MALEQFFRKGFYLQSHLEILFRRMTLKKAMNLLLNQMEYLFRKQELRSYPPFFKIDPSVRCQLRCIGCGQSKDEFRASLPKKSFLTFNEFKKIVDPLASTTLGISLSFYGEPLLNPNIIDMIEYSSSKNIGITFPSNFSLELSDDFLKRLVKSGLDSVFIALDGASQGTYQQYRVGGNFPLIIDNVRRLSRIKRQVGSKTPIIVWKFVTFEHNKHEVGIVRREYRNWGFDTFRIVQDVRTEAARERRISGGRKKKACFWLYNSINVEVDGSIRPCCSFMQEKWGIGNAINDDIRSMWNSNRYQALRRGFSLKNYGNDMHPTCFLCMTGNRKP